MRDRRVGVVAVVWAVATVAVLAGCARPVASFGPAAAAEALGVDVEQTIALGEGVVAVRTGGGADGGPLVEVVLVRPTITGPASTVLLRAPLAGERPTSLIGACGSGSELPVRAVMFGVGSLPGGSARVLNITGIAAIGPPAAGGAGSPYVALIERWALDGVGPDDPVLLGNEMSLLGRTTVRSLLDLLATVEATTPNGCAMGAAME
jgi:hypothetical protein